MRGAYTYLAEVVKEMNALAPRSSRPYEYLYLGKLPSVRLSDGFVDSRPLHIPGKDVCERIIMRYRITPIARRMSLLGEDIERCIEYLKGSRSSTRRRPKARNDFGKVAKALFTVTGSLPCEIMLRADYENQGHHRAGERAPPRTQ